MPVSLLLAAALALGQSATRADLATGLMRFERALRDHPPAEPQRVEVERGFDALTLAFFSGASGAALRDLDALTAALDPARRDSPAERSADALGFEVEPRALAAQAGGRVTVRVRRVHASDGAMAGTAELVLQAREGAAEPCASRRIDLAALAEDGTALELALEVPPRPAGPCEADLSLRLPGCAPRVVGQVALLAQPIAALRADLQARIARLEPDGPPLVQACAAARARVGLLDPAAVRTDTAQLLTDLGTLARDLEREVSALERGADPYRRRPGELWRVVELDPERTLPVRIYAPRAACGDARAPLVIALHGAGGDENMFLSAYGLGRLRELADEHGFVVACPRVGFAGLPAEAFDALVRALVFDYAIDPKRVHVLGHSMGAAAAAGLAQQRASRVASVALLAGAPRAGKALPPHFVAVGELDPLAQAPSVRRAAEALRAQDVEVELRVLPGRGHTLFVGDVLPDAIRWLLARPRP